jgi:hypothetical protein
MDVRRVAARAGQLVALKECPLAAQWDVKRDTLRVAKWAWLKAEK